MSTGRNQMSLGVTKSPAARVANVEPRVSTVLQRQALCRVFGAMQASLNRLRKRAPLIEDRAAGQAVADIAVVHHRLKVAVGVRIVQRAVLAEALDVVGPLHVMHQRLDLIAGGEQVAEPIELDAPRVAAPFGEQLELACVSG